MKPRHTSGDLLAGDRLASWAVGSFLVVSATVALLASVPDLRHWFVVPVAICGVLVSPDVVDWARRRLDTFDPQAMLALLGVHFFFLAPLLHVALDWWPRFIPPSADWRHALGQMAILNAVGLLLYRIVLVNPDRPTGKPGVRVDLPKLRTLGGLTVAVSVAAFVAYVASFGGPAAYLAAISSTDRDLAGYGPLLLVARAFPPVAFALVLISRRDYFRRHTGAMFVTLAVFTLVTLATVGLGGSRAATVWPFLIGLAMCHLIVQPIRRRALVAACLTVAGFMYLYGFYKSAGVDSLGILTGEATAADLTNRTGRDLPGLLLGDLGRADIQALVLERHGTAGLGYGLTYVGDAKFLLPDSLTPSVPDKVALGTDVLFGRGAYGPGFRASNVYGLAGEAVLNFGRLGAVAAFAALGFFVRYARRTYRRAAGADGSLAARLLAPTLPVLAMISLGSDFDNVLWWTINHVLVLAVLVLASREPSQARRTQPSA